MAAREAVVGLMQEGLERAITAEKSLGQQVQPHRTPHRQGKKHGLPEVFSKEQVPHDEKRSYPQHLHPAQKPQHQADRLQNWGGQRMHQTDDPAVKADVLALQDLIRYDPQNDQGQQDAKKQKRQRRGALEDSS